MASPPFGLATVFFCSAKPPYECVFGCSWQRWLNDDDRRPFFKEARAAAAITPTMPTTQKEGCKGATACARRAQKHHLLLCLLHILRQDETILPLKASRCTIRNCIAMKLKFSLQIKHSWTSVDSKFGAQPTKYLVF